MRFGSVCSGIEAASVAWTPLGWEAAWLSEIEPFPAAVLKHHYPEVPNFGDMTTLPERIRSGEVEAPDVFCGGTPCQAFSVAGLRRSLDDARGNLSLTFCEIADAIDDIRCARGDEPTIIFWENVPGVLSTKDNAFGCFLAGLAGEDQPLVPSGNKWTHAGVVLGPKRAIAWRVLDAQYFGLAQRRRRVFVVASARDGFNPAKIIFEQQGVRRDFAPSRATGKAIAPTVTSGPPFSRAGNDRVEAEAMVVQPVTYDFFNITAPVNRQNRNPGDPCHTLARANAEHAVLMQPIAIQGCRGVEKAQNGRGWNDDGVAYTVDTHATQGVMQPVAVAQPVAEPYTLAIRGRGDSHNLEYRQDGTANALLTPNGGRGGVGVGAIAQPVAFDSYNLCETGDITQTLKSPQGGVTESIGAVRTAMQVRRLTLVECERLMGFPDGYSAIPWRGKPASDCPDGPRYKALGNSWAVPVVRWIGRRINMVDLGLL